uniref:Dirigent protein n=1 Tax=Setaria italica TaxID=4555 RepID=K3ZMS5_SETIT
NEYGVINSPEPIGARCTSTTGFSPQGSVQLKMSWFYLQAGQTTTSWYTAHTIVRSALDVSGITEVKPNSQWSITGGTVAFASAHGTIKFINSQSSTATDAIKELDIHVFHTPEATHVIFAMTLIFAVQVQVTTLDRSA